MWHLLTQAAPTLAAEALGLWMVQKHLKCLCHVAWKVAQMSRVEQLLHQLQGMPDGRTACWTLTCWRVWRRVMLGLVRAS